MVWPTLKGTEALLNNGPSILTSFMVKTQPYSIFSLLENFGKNFDYPPLKASDYSTFEKT